MTKCLHTQAYWYYVRQKHHTCLSNCEQ